MAELSKFQSTAHSQRSLIIWNVAYLKVRVSGLCCLLVYASKIFEIVGKHNLEIHCYADDSQLYLSFCPNDNANQEAALARVERCIEDIRNWMLNDKLKLNDDKTEFMIIGTSQQLAKVSINSLRVGTATITPVSSARNLGSWFDSKLTATLPSIICII